MVTTYPLRNTLVKTSGKSSVLRQLGSKAKKTAAIGSKSDPLQQTTTAPPETEDDNYYLGRLIYML